MSYWLLVVDSWAADGGVLTLHWWLKRFCKLKRWSSKTFRSAPAINSLIPGEGYVNIWELKRHQRRVLNGKKTKEKPLKSHTSTDACLNTFIIHWNDDKYCSSTHADSRSRTILISRTSHALQLSTPLPRDLWGKVEKMNWRKSENLS